jgi:glycosyltransferase involved in cell wall biosynthesis
MIVNWVSPLPPARTDIANYTLRVLPALQKFAAVRLWTDQRVWDEAIEAQAPVYSFSGDTFDQAAFAQADVSVYHIGNNRLFHGGIWDLAERAPGIVVLHDTRLLQFVAGVLLDQRRDRRAFDAMLRRFYGDDGAAAAQRFARGELRIDDAVASFPMARALADHALGLVLHAPPPAHELDDLPTASLPLPFDVAREPTFERSSGATLQLVQFGFLGGNRRLAQVLQAIAASDARNRIVFDIYGPVDDEKSLRAAIAAEGLDQHVRLHGFVSEAQLSAALDAADLVFNLRHPSMGEASASQLRIWSHARAAFVSDVAWYAAQPDETLIKVKPGEEVPRIVETLRAYGDDPARFEAIGRAGFARLRQVHTSAAYAEQLAAFLQTLPTLRRHFTARRVAERAGREMRTWLKQPPQSLLTAPVVARLHDLWGDGAASVAQPPPPARFAHPAFSPAKKLARRILNRLR